MQSNACSFFLIGKPHADQFMYCTWSCTCICYAYAPSADLRHGIIGHQSIALLYLIYGSLVSAVVYGRWRMDRAARLTDDYMIILAFEPTTDSGP
jgi:hypothetical protein